MSQICIKISICVSFFIFSFGLVYVTFEYGKGLVVYHDDNPAHDDKKQIELRFSNPEVHCSLNDNSGSSSLPLKTPSLESLIRASSTVENPEHRLSGLAVFSNLSDACQPPVDVSKSNIQVYKIALITIAYGTQNDSQDKLLIPVLQAAQDCFEVYPNGTRDWFDPRVDDHILVDADRSNVEISVSQNTDDLTGMVSLGPADHTLLV